VQYTVCAIQIDVLTFFLPLSSALWLLLLLSVTERVSGVVQEKSYAEAASKYQHVKQTTGHYADTLYSLAVCQYKLKDYKSVVINCNDIISNAAKDHPGCWSLLAGCLVSSV